MERRHSATGVNGLRKAASGKTGGGEIAKREDGTGSAPLRPMTKDLYQSLERLR